jgi:hypothetical protein
MVMHQSYRCLALPRLVVVTLWVVAQECNNLGPAESLTHLKEPLHIFTCIANAARNEQTHHLKPQTRIGLSPGHLYIAM